MKEIVIVCLPKLPELYCALVVREGGGASELERTTIYREPDRRAMEGDNLASCGTRLRAPVRH
jgi:hypothetical protein